MSGIDKAIESKETEFRLSRQTLRYQVLLLASRAKELANHLDTDICADIPAEAWESFGLLGQKVDASYQEGVSLARDIEALKGLK